VLKDFSFVLVFCEQHSLSQPTKDGLVFMNPLDTEPEVTDLKTVSKHLRHVAVGFVTCWLDREKKKFTAHATPLLMKPAALALLETMVAEATSGDMQPHHEPRFHDFARRCTGPAAMVLGNSRGEALLFSLGGPDSRDDEVSSAMSEGFTFAGIVGFINDRLEYEGETSHALAMAHAVDAFAAVHAVPSETETETQSVWVCCNGCKLPGGEGPFAWKQGDQPSVCPKCGSSKTTKVI
jgi:hypothetical protein